MELTAERVKRYARQIVLREVGRDGQRRLMTSAVVVAGENDAAAVARTYLAASGVGTIVVAGAPNAEARRVALRESLSAVNPDVAVFDLAEMPSGPTIDAAIDASFNADWAHGVVAPWANVGPWLHLGASSLGGHVSAVRGGNVYCGACAGSTSQGAASPSLAMALGAAAATMAAKVILGLGAITFGRVHGFDRFGLPCHDERGSGGA